jgi:hypothetical protein
MLRLCAQGFVYGGAPIFLLGWGVAYLRLWYLRKIALRFKELKGSQNPKDIHCFTDEYEVEIVSRVARQWDAEGNFDLQAVELGELILQVGKAFHAAACFDVSDARVLLEAVAADC